MPSSSKTDLTITVNIRNFIISLKGRLSSHSNLIFIKSFFIHLFLSPFIVSVRYLISSESFINFANTYLLPSAEIKTKYLFALFSSIYPSTLPIIRFNEFTLLY